MASATQRWIVGGIGLAVVAVIAMAAWLRVPPPAPPQRAAEPPAASAEVPAAGEPAAAVMPPTSGSGASQPATDPNQRAMNAWTAGDIEAAMAFFEQAIAAAPDDPEPHGNYGRLLTLMVSYERAIPLLERARDLAPGDAQAWLDLATVYERAQRLDDAWAARAEAEKLVGASAITRDERGRFVVAGTSLW